MPLLLSDLHPGERAEVHGLAATDADLDTTSLRRLAELGFLPGEPVQLVQRGPGGREPLAVRVGDSLFALRLAEARCVQVRAPAAHPTA
ncbi:FeoA family protein [Ideonella livida]|uniref:Ferrous iron transport protein A n=1 Tax=Ideonella livida TaxID=2707176 RepID=A0A7C9PKD0_9BURK|nr:FeoA family protein [Ideonella livida]NDY93371.1 ferrous iron transport protein A [Ideonella livida]